MRAHPLFPHPTSLRQRADVLHERIGRHEYQFHVDGNFSQLPVWHGCYRVEVAA